MEDWIWETIGLLPAEAPTELWEEVMLEHYGRVASHREICTTPLPPETYRALVERIQILWMEAQL